MARDSLSLSALEVREMERLVASRMAGLHMLGCAPNDIVLERLEELHNMLARWRLEVREILVSNDC